MTQLADRIGMSRGGLHTAISNKTLTIKTLEQIAEVLEVPVTYFFTGYDESPNLKQQLESLKLENFNLEKTNSYIKALEENKENREILIKMLRVHIKSVTEKLCEFLDLMPPLQFDVNNWKVEMEKQMTLRHLVFLLTMTPEGVDMNEKSIKTINQFIPTVLDFNSNPEPEPELKDKALKRH